MQKTVFFTGKSVFGPTARFFYGDARRLEQ
jgi:hypothetical protein